MRKKLFILFFGCLTFFNSYSQVGMEEEDQEEYSEEDEEIVLEKSVMVGANFQMGFPQGRFGKNLDALGWGFGGNIMWKFKRNPQIHGGIEFGIHNLESASIINSFGFGDDYELKTKNSIALAHFQLRYYPEFNFFVRPYVEALIGAKSLLTRTTETDLNSNETINSEFNNSDFAMSFGGAIGFEIPIQKEYLFLEARLAYTKGNAANYYARRMDNPSFLNPIDAFELKNSATDLLIPQIGFKFLIGFASNEDEEYEEEYYEEDY